MSADIIHTSVYDVVAVVHTLFLTRRHSQAHGRKTEAQSFWGEENAPTKEISQTKADTRTEDVRRCDQIIACMHLQQSRGTYGLLFRTVKCSHSLHEPKTSQANDADRRKETRRNKLALRFSCMPSLL